MTSRPTTVSADLELRLVVPGSASLPVMASIQYLLDDPYAVHVTFHTGGDRGTVDWSFARQLLTDGLTQPTGEGDVRVWPSHVNGHATVFLALSSPSGEAVFEVGLHELAEYLTQSYTLVPTGSESDFVDIDAELALLLWSDSE
ncbi:MAG TPA: SsgA family sporulation/cell division regulator [Mycobacteriales bacterium]|nr:SsgA family sporulation/cell division regulator [Mycobacteriales bacterium]